MRVGFVPLDERPVNSRYPRMLAEMAGIQIELPPPELLSRFRQPGDCAGIADWLRQRSASWDALVVSLETLVYGGLVPSRIGGESLATVVQRLSILREIKAQQPELRVYGFSLITRISKNRASVEEPAYWHESGPELYRFSQQHDAYRWGAGAPPRHEGLNRQHLQDLLRRRARNHCINLATLDLLFDDVFDLLVISSDDTSEYGFGTREKAWLREWTQRYGGDERLLMYPGADEVGSALLARALTVAHGWQPRCRLHYAIPADAERIAPFEDGPLRLTVERQLRAVGAVQVAGEQDADLIIAINPPAPSNQDFYNPDYAESDRAYRASALERFAAQIQAWIRAEQPVVVCDVAYPNGSDPVLIEALQRHCDLRHLAAYGAWNTAGNSIGVALAQGIAGHNNADSAAAQQFLAHRFIEDYAYMHLLRPGLPAEPTLYTAEQATALSARIESELNAALAQIPSLRGWRVRHVRLPWQRRFEVDFDLERV